MEFDTMTEEVSTEQLSKIERVQVAMKNPLLVVRELNNRSLYHFVQWFWPVICNQTFVGNWHLELFCKELEVIAERVGDREEKLYDLIANVPPGTSKTIVFSIMFPAWCWTRWYWMRFITASYSAALSLESAEYCRDLIRSDQFKTLYPEIAIRDDKDTKSNFKIVKEEPVPGRPGRNTILQGGNRYSTSVGGTLMGFHGDILIWDDPLNPTQSVSDKERETANAWIDRTLPTRKTDKGISVIIGIMQRLHQDDPTGHVLAKKKKNVKNISLPGEILNFKDQVQPPELAEYYVNNLLDPKRLNWKVLKDLEADLGQYGYAGQIGQNPIPVGGGMFHVDHFGIATVEPPANEILRTYRYWDKAGTAGGGAFTVGVKMSQLTRERFFVHDVKRGQWSTDERERIILEVARLDGRHVNIYIEQEPGSGGKESAESTIRHLAGFACYADRPTGDKAYRADPYSVQVNNGAVSLLSAPWNTSYIEEHRFFPLGTYKDQVDASSGAFNHLTARRLATRIT